VTALEFEAQFLAQHELGIAHRVPHLQEILEGHGGDRVGVGLAQLEEPLERRSPVAG